MKNLFVLWLAAMMFVACGDDCSSNATDKNFSKESGTLYSYMDVLSIDAEKIVTDNGSCKLDSLGNIYWRSRFSTNLYTIHQDSLLFREVDEDGDTSIYSVIHIGNNSSIIGNWYLAPCEYRYNYYDRNTELECFEDPFITNINFSNEVAILSGKLDPNYDFMSNNDNCNAFGEVVGSLCYEKYDSFRNIQGVFSVPDIVILNDSISMIRKTPSSYVTKIGSAEILLSETYDITEDSWTRHSTVSFNGKTCSSYYTNFFIPKEKCNESNMAAYIEFEKNHNSLLNNYNQCLKDLHLPQIQEPQALEDNVLHKKAAVYRPHTKKRTLFEK